MKTASSSIISFLAAFAATLTFLASPCFCEPEKPPALEEKKPRVSVPAADGPADRSKIPGYVDGKWPSIHSEAEKRKHFSEGFFRSLTPKTGPKKLADYDPYSKGLIHAAFAGDEGAVKKLCDSGARVDAADGAGMTPLMVACANGHQKIAEALIKKGAKVNAKDRDGRTAAMFAAQNGRDAIVAMLIKKGADLLATDVEGKGPWLHAMERGHEKTAALLAKHGAEESYLYILEKTRKAGDSHRIAWADEETAKIFKKAK